jgi:hypothetical protein
LPIVYALTTPKAQWEDANGNPLSGYKLFVYDAGTTTKTTTYQDAAGTTPNSNPIVLNSLGQATAGIYVTTGAKKLVMAPPTDSDPPSSPLWSQDSISAINDTSLTFDQWIAGPTPTYTSVTTFTLVGDQTSTFQVGRRIKASVTAGTVYGRISASAFGAVTTVTVVLDSGTLDSGLSAVWYGLLSASNPSIPTIIDTYPLRTGSSDVTKMVTLEVDVLPSGVNRTLYPTLPKNSQTTAYTVVAADYGKVLTLSGTFSLTLTAAATLGEGWHCWVNNIGTGVITIDPNSTETIFVAGGAQTPATTITLPYSGSTQGPYNVAGGVLWCDGSNWTLFPAIQAHGEQLFISNGTWTAPAGVNTIWLDGCAGGAGGGGVGTNAGSAAGGGGGGHSLLGGIYNVVPGTAYTVTVGTGGAGGVASNPGTGGVNSSFGGLQTLTGGTGGQNSNGAAGAGGAAGGGGATAGWPGFNITGSTSQGGAGGGTIWGAPTPHVVNGASNGNAASVYGAGGSGAIAGAGGATKDGGAGAAGFWRVRW